MPAGGHGGSCRQDTGPHRQRFPRRRGRFQSAGSWSHGGWDRAPSYLGAFIIRTGRRRNRDRDSSAGAASRHGPDWRGFDCENPPRLARFAELNDTEKRRSKESWERMGKQRKTSREEISSKPHSPALARPPWPELEQRRPKPTMLPGTGTKSRMS